MFPTGRVPASGPGIHVLVDSLILKEVAGRDKPGHQRVGKYSVVSPELTPVNGEVSLQPSPTVLKALLIQEPLFSNGSLPPDFTS
jgi:hypothetical protein